MNVNVDIQTQLDAFGPQLNLSSIINGCKADFTNFYGSAWMDFTHLTIQSFHNSASDIIPQASCCIAGNPTVLKPVQDGIIPDCRPSDIKFIWVQLQLDFANLMTAPAPPGDPAPVTILHANYYIQLPQATCQVVNGVGDPYQLTTWHGFKFVMRFAPMPSGLPHPTRHSGLQLTRHCAHQLH